MKPRDRGNEKPGKKAAGHRDASITPGLGGPSLRGAMENMDPMDRILEFALEELERERSHGGACSSAPDMLERVRSAWQAGQRGQDLSDLHSVLVKPERPRRKEPTRPTAVVDEQAPSAPGFSGLGDRLTSKNLLVAALVLLSMGGAWYWINSLGAIEEDLGGGQGPPLVAGNADQITGSGTGSQTPTATLDGAPVLADLAETRRTDIDERLDALLLPPLIARGLAAEEEMTRFERRELLANLAEDAHAWSYLTQDLDQKLTQAPPSTRAGQRLVALAREAPPRFGTPLGRSLWLRIPGSFESFDLVDFAERKLFEFERELVAKSQERDPEDWERDAASEAIASAWLVNRGDPRGLAGLDLALDKLSLEPEDPRLDQNLWSLVVAGSLLRTAQGGDAWSRTQAKVTRLVGRLKDLGNFEGASVAVDMLEFAYKAPAPPAFPLLGLSKALSAPYAQEDWQDLEKRLDALAEDSGQ